MQTIFGQRMDGDVTVSNVHHDPFTEVYERFGEPLGVGVSQAHLHVAHRGGSGVRGRQPSPGCNVLDVEGPGICNLDVPLRMNDVQRCNCPGGGGMD